MDYTDIISLFDSELGYTNFDDNKIKQLERSMKLFKLHLIQKNEEHTLFLATNLTGVYNAVYSSLDSEKFFSIFNLSEKKLSLQINKLPDMMKEWNIASNPHYLLSLYLIHKLTHSNYKDKDKVILIIFEIMSYKILTSIIYQFYKTKLTVDEAKAVYEKITYKYLIKRLGSWDEVIKYKANLVLPKGTYYLPIEKLTTKDAMDVAAAIQTSYKSLIKYIASISHSGNKTKIGSTNSVEETGDGKKVREIENQSVYINYIKNIIAFENDFVNVGLIKIIANKIKNVEVDNVKYTLQYLSKNHKDNKYLDTIIEHCFEFLISKGISDYMGNMDYLNQLKGYWSSGNPKLKDVKKYLKEISYKATGRKTEWILNSTTVAVILYIFVRALTKNNI